MPKSRPIHPPVTRTSRSARTRAGADPNSKNEEGDPALHWAVVCGDAEGLRLLLAAGANPNTEDHVGGNALDYAIEAREPPGVLLLLLAAGADMNHKDECNRTALSYAWEARKFSRPGAGKIFELLEAVARTTKKRPADQVRRAPLPTTENRTGAETG